MIQADRCQLTRSTRRSPPWLGGLLLNHLDESSFVQIADLFLIARGRGVSALHIRLLSGLLGRSAALVASLRRIISLVALIWLIHILRHNDSLLCRPSTNITTSRQEIGSLLQTDGCPENGGLYAGRYGFSWQQSWWGEEVVSIVRDADCRLLSDRHRPSKATESSPRWSVLNHRKSLKLSLSESSKKPRCEVAEEDKELRSRQPT
jgi:hypothetical protein